MDYQPGVVHVGCWAHARRRFVDAVKVSKKRKKPKKGIAQDVLGYITSLYEIEKKIKELEPEVIYRTRQQESKPILEELKSCLEDNAPKVPPQSLLGKAINYTLSQWPRLIRYIEDGRLRMDNNLIENGIRPFALGRKNWLFSGHPRGAEATAAMFSLIESAKANGIEPASYLKALFERIPLAKTEKDYKALLPQYIDKDLVNLMRKQDKSTQNHQHSVK